MLKKIFQFSLPVAMLVFFLWWFNQGRSFLAAFFYLAGAFYFYFRPFVFSFLLIVLLPFFVVAPLRGWGEFFYLAAWSVLFSMLLFLKKSETFADYIYQILNGLLLFIVFLLFFSSVSGDFFWLKFLLFFAAIFFLTKETVPTLFAAVASLLIIELSWAAMFLPIGFLNQSALLLVIILALKNIISAHFSQALSRNVILKNITFIIVFVLVIFIASRW